jgi:hypothetical protein
MIALLAMVVIYIMSHRLHLFKRDDLDPVITNVDLGSDDNDPGASDTGSDDNNFFDKNGTPVCLSTKSRRARNSLGRRNWVTPTKSIKFSSRLTM